MEIVIKVTNKQLKHIASELANNIFEEWDREICEFAGVYKAELVEGIMESYEFSKYVEGKVLAHGPDFLDYPYEYENFMPELGRVEQHISIFCDIWREAEHAARNAINEETLNAAMHIVRKAGYEIR